MNLPGVCFSLLISLSLAWAQPAAGFDHSHVHYTEILAAHVDSKGFVNYAALKTDPDPLGRYIDTLGAVEKSVFDRWSRDQQLAFLINLYNAQTLKLVIDHHPVTGIKSIGGIRGPWKIKVVPLWGRKKSLDQLEHEIIRPNYADPRIHFALVCAARSCPPLRTEAYRANSLDTQLNDQGRRFLNDPSKNRFDARNRTLSLSRIFEWFEADFTANSPSLPAYVAPFLPESARRALAAGNIEVRYLDYDWSLNDQRP
jgi:hypothetical protein